MLSEYSFNKTGNLIGIILTFVSLVFVFLNLFSKSNFRDISIISIGILSLMLVLTLIIIFYVSDKDFKLVILFINFFLRIYLLISLIFVFFSKSKKIRLFNNLGYLLIIFVLIFLTIFYFVYTHENDENLYKNGNRKADAGVILGAAVWGGNRPSPVLRERINKGYEIYEKKYATRLILTGGGSPNELTEAEVSKNELIKYGVEPKNLLVEDKSNSTNEQIQYVRDKYYKKMKFTRIIIVSDNFHLFRASEICKFNSMNIDTFSSDTPLSAESNINFCIKETFAVLIFWLFGIG